MTLFFVGRSHGFGPGEGGEVEGEGGAVGRVEGGGGGECADEAVAKGADAIVAGDGGEGGGGGEDGAGESQHRQEGWSVGVECLLAVAEIAGCYFFPDLFQSGE